MEYTLTIDQGNSTSKVTVFADNKIENRWRFESLSIEDLYLVLERYTICDAIYCSVSRFDAKLVESLRHTISGELIVLTHETELPIKINYKTPHTLGLDRIAASVGAYILNKEQSSLIVDAGTAVTIDIFDAQRGFLGGNISPGLYLRFFSLNKLTDALPMLEITNSDISDFGYDTESAIRAGVIGGLLSELVSSYSKMQQLCGENSKMILTGGDAEYIYGKLQNIIASDKLVLENDLVAVGLKCILNYNENI